MTRYSGFLSFDGRGTGTSPRPQRTDPRPSEIPPSIDHLARSLAAALARTLRAYLPLEQRSVESRLDALDARITQLEGEVHRVQGLALHLAESLTHSFEDES